MAAVYHFPEETFLLVGKIAKPHGLRGEVKVHAFSDEAGTLLDYSEVVLIDETGRMSPALAIENGRLQGRTVVLKLENVDDRNAAEAIHGMGILIEKRYLPEIERDEYYWFQFYGLSVHTDKGRYLGKVRSIFSNGAQDIMVVEDGDNEYLIPIINSIVSEHTENGVVITPPPGLLEINDGDT